MTRARKILMTLAAAVMVASMSLVGASTAAAQGGPPPAIAENATEDHLKWQPVSDYDTDGCYPSTAIDAQGNVATGLPLRGGLASECRDASDLENSNSYVRSMCVEDGWCATMYAYYFEKDQVFANTSFGGHVHDVEHVIVWTQNDQAKYVSVSQHGRYSTRAAKDVLWQGTSPKVVYNKDGLFTHVLRFATAADDAIENATGQWHQPKLLSWELMSDTVRNTLNTYDYKTATFEITDAKFEARLAEWAPAGTPFAD